MNIASGLSLWLLACLIISINTQAVATEPTFSNGHQVYVADEVLVILKDQADPESFDDSSIRRKGISGKVLRKMRLANSRKTLARVKIADGMTVEQALLQDWKSKDSRILHVEPNYQVYALATPNDPLISSLWGHHNYGQTSGTVDCDIDLPEAWNIATGSSNIIVAVIDSGVDYTHPELTNRIWVNPNEIPNNGLDDDNNGYIDDTIGYDFVENDNDPYDENGHGTHCSGIIGAEGNNNLDIVGVNWDCQIMPCRFLNASGSGTTTDAIEAINYAVENGAKILNNSWGGGGYSAALKAAIENAEQQGVLFIAAAGNSGTNNDQYPHYPSNYSCDNIIAVAATDHHDRLAGFSCYGRQSVDIAAPGVSILSTVPGGYSWYSGTSMATPYVSGVAALLLSLDPDMTVLELKSRLVWTGDSLAELADVTASGRRLNAYQALSVSRGLTFQTPADGTKWATGLQYPIQWSSIGADDTVSLYLFKNGVFVETIAQNVSNTGSYAWIIPGNLVYGEDYSILIEDSSVSAETDLFTITDEHIDYYTESFSDAENVFDLSNKAVLFVADGNGGYKAITQDIETLPSSEGRSRVLRMGDDDSVSIDLGGQTVELFGIEYSQIYVSSNGYITFDEPDYEYRPELSNHFMKPRISALFADLDPSAGGKVSYIQSDDRITVTWLTVPQFRQNLYHTFQAELYFNGNIRLSWLDNPGMSSVCGFSDGLGLPENFFDSNLSLYASYSPELQFFNISGPGQVLANQSMQLQCTGYYSDEITLDITDRDIVEWNIESGNGVINSTGILDAGHSTIFQHIEVSAVTDEAIDRFGVFVKGQNVNDLEIIKCALKAGRKPDSDSLAVTGLLDLNLNDIESTASIDVKIWSDQNVCVYETIFANHLAAMTANSYNNRTQQPTVSGFSNESVRVNMGKNIIMIKISKADLSGIHCPFYMTIECGDRKFVGQLTETVVNSKKTCPFSLMSGVEDTFGVDRLRVKSNRKGCSLNMTGQFSLATAIDSADDASFQWNQTVYTAALKRNAGRYHIFETNDRSFSAKIDLVRGLFKIVVNDASLDTNRGIANTGLYFSDFGQSRIVEF